MAFLQTFVSQQLLFLFSKHLDTMSNVKNCVSSQTDLWVRQSEQFLPMMQVHFFSDQTLDLRTRIEI